jgi:hypothetical protein
MSFIGSMVAAASAISAAAGGGILGGLAVGATGALGGAGLGAAASAIDGGDPLEGAQMGAGIGSAVFGGIGALGSAGVIGSAAPIAGSTVAPVAGSTVAPVVSNAAPAVVQEGVNQGAQQAVQQGAQQAVQQGAQQVVQEGVNQGAQQGAQQVVKEGAQQAVQQGAQQAVKEGAQQGISSLPGQPGFVGPQATQGQIANASAYTDANMGTRLLADLTGQQGNIVGNTGLKMAGGALQNSVINSGINGLVAGAQGQDVGEAMGKGALTGAVGGTASEGLASMAGSGGTLGSIGNFAAKHDVLVPAALSMGSGMALDSALTSNPTAPEQKGIRSLYKWDNNAYQPYRTMAAGGVTDLDNYDQAPQMQNPGTLDIPNRNEVSNNQGYMGDSVQLMAMGGMAYNHGGVSDLGGYSDGGRLLKGPGDGVSDDIPASIGGKQPARLAEGEFVVPARIVSELGNGSTDAGAKRLYQMMDRIQSDRKKTTGKGKFSDNPKASRHLPA